MSFGARKSEVGSFVDIRRATTNNPPSFAFANYGEVKKNQTSRFGSPLEQSREVFSETGCRNPAVVLGSRNFYFSKLRLDKKNVKSSSFVATKQNAVLRIPDGSSE